METLFRVVANSSAKDKHARVMRTVVDEGNGHRPDGEKVGRKFQNAQNADRQPQICVLWGREKGGKNTRCLRWCTRNLDLSEARWQPLIWRLSGAGSCRRCPAVPIPTGISDCRSLTDVLEGLTVVKVSFWLPSCCCGSCPGAGNRTDVLFSAGRLRVCMACQDPARAASPP